MKLLLLLFSFFLIGLKLNAQSYSGLWVGVLRSDMGKASVGYKLYLQINQDGKALWGVYTSGDSDIEKANCACKVKISRSKSDSSFITIHNDKVVANKISKSTCEALIFLQGDITRTTDTQFLSGKWYGVYSSRYRNDGASGEIRLVRVSDTNSEYINQYFPDLENYIAKKNEDE